jgi:hypothetical protein
MKKMTSGRKKILFQTDFSLAKTGFGRTAKAILTYLFNLDKYDIVHLCCGKRQESPDLQKTPWKSIGTIPINSLEVEQVKKEEAGKQKAFYGVYNLDEVVYKEKPDIYIGIQDIWGLTHAIQKPWFKEITSAVWTTLDSLPILPAAVESSKICSNFWVWSEFATKELHSMGHSHVKTVHGPIEDKFFYRLPDHDRVILRNENKIDEDAFVIGFVFRNQLRKSVPNLLEGYAKWKKKNKPDQETRLLLHTTYTGDWDINKLASETGVELSEIITTYICKDCKNYSVKTFTEENISCDHCLAEKSCTTPNPDLGVSEEQLNEIYNLMDVYCHPFTSGGQEIPIQEAKLTELITLVTNYSCGEEMCYPEAHSIPLKWTEYREHKTEFKKASTCSDSIAESLNEVFSMSQKEKESMGKKAREWTLNNYSLKKLCKFIEEFVESSPHAEYDFSKKEEGTGSKISDFLSSDDEGKRILYVIPQGERDVFNSTSLFKSIKELYLDYNLYVATNKEYFSILNGNPYIHKVINYSPQMDNIFWLEGRGDHKGYFEIAFLPYINTQKIITFTHNGKDKIAYKDLTY